MSHIVALRERLRAFVVAELRAGGDLTLLACLGLTLWVCGPLLMSPEGTLAGDPSTDAIRGMWSFDHLRRSLLPPETPLWSHHVNFPEGVLALVLPWVSGILLAPAGLLLGPVSGYNFAVGALIFGVGFSSAALIRTLSGSWAAGIAFGGAMLAQPTLLHSVADGTPEHIAFWLVPLFLAAGWATADQGRVGLAILTGLLAGAVALDSPYHAIYAAVLGLIALGPMWVGALRGPRRADVVRALVALLIVGALVGGALFWLFQFFPIESRAVDDDGALLKLNSVDLHTWWQQEWGFAGPRDPSLAPTVIPSVPLVAALVLSLAHLRRSLPWVLAGVVMLALSLGQNPRIPAELAVWMGETGADLGRTLLSWNADLYSLPGIGSIRFPRRWLLPAGFAFMMAGGIGLGRIFRAVNRFPWGRPVTLVLALLLAIGGVQQGLHGSRFHDVFPAQALPPIAFAAWIGERGGGALLTLPQIRPAPKQARRDTLPVFANLSDSLSSVDVAYIQVLSGRPTVEYPSLKTLAPMRLNGPLFRQLRNWDDIARAAQEGGTPPRAAIDEHHAPEREAILAAMVAAGIEYICVDVAAFNEETLDILRTQLRSVTAEERRFEDGTGVLVFVLQAPKP